MPARAVPYGPARQAPGSLAILDGASNGAAITHATIDSVTITGSGGPSTVTYGNLQPVEFSQVALNDPFWAPRIDRNRTAGLPILYQSFIDNHNLDNFSKAAGLMAGNHDGFLWADSDVYKTLEGMAKAIHLHADAGLQAKLEDAVNRIAAAQISSGPMSGYIDTYFQLGNAGRGDGGTTVTTQPRTGLPVFLTATFDQSATPALEAGAMMLQLHANGQPVGCIFLVRGTRRIGKLRLFLVEPALRGLGIGARLIEECVRFARSAGYRKVRLWTQSELLAARRQYERAGFRLLAEESHDSWSRQNLVSETWELRLTPPRGRAGPERG